MATEGLNNQPKYLKYLTPNISTDSNVDSLPNNNNINQTKDKPNYLK